MNDDKPLIIIEPLLAEMFMKKITGWAMLPDERATYYLWEAIYTLMYIPELQERIKEKLGTQYNNRIQELNKKMSHTREIKILLDHLDDHVIKKNDIETQTWKRTIKILHEEQNLIETTGLYILTIIAQNTNIGKWTLKNTDQQIYLREYKKFSDYNVRQAPNQQTQNPQGGNTQ